jgi:hypothetical protein
MKLSSVAMEQFVSLALGAGARSESRERVQKRPSQQEQESFDASASFFPGEIPTQRRTCCSN